MLLQCVTHVQGTRTTKNAAVAFLVIQSKYFLLTSQKSPPADVEAISFENSALLYSLCKDTMEMD